MSFIETPRFPENISRGSRFGPEYRTSVARNRGGYRAVNKEWTLPLHRGDVIHGVKKQADMDDLVAFFHAMAGQYNGFRFKHWGDYTCTGTQGTVTLLTATTWQMYKTYTFGAVSASRKIAKPVSGTVAVTGGGSYTIDYTTGIITKTSGANPSGWTGEFDFPVAFETDVMNPSWLSFGVYEWSAIPIVELRL